MLCPRFPPFPCLYAQHASHAKFTIAKAEADGGAMIDMRRFDKAAVVLRVNDTEVMGSESGRTHYYAKVASVMKYDLEKLEFDDRGRQIRPRKDPASLKRVYSIVTVMKDERWLANGSSATLYIDRFKEDIWYVLGDSIRTGTSHVAAGKPVQKEHAVAFLKKAGAQLDADEDDRVIDVRLYFYSGRGERPTKAPTVNLPPEQHNSLLYYCSHLPFLKRLTITGLHLNDDALTNLKMLNLEHLGIGSDGITDAGLEELKTLGNLKPLGLGGAKLTDRVLVHLAHLRELESLVLDVKTQDGLAGLSKLSSLKVLNLANVDDAGLEHVGKLKGLAFLVLSRTAVTDRGFEPLVALEKLKHLTLAFTEVGDDGMRHVGRLSNLKWLELNATNVGSAGLAELHRLKNLKTLRLSATNVDDTGLSHLRSLPTLETLDLSNTAVSDEGLVHLADIKSLVNLTIHSTKVTKAGADRLKRDRPDMRIEWYTE